MKKIELASFIVAMVAVVVLCIVGMTTQFAAAKDAKIPVQKYEDDNLIYLDWGEEAIEDMTGYELSIKGEETVMDNTIAKMGFSKSFKGEHVTLKLKFKDGRLVLVYDDEL